MDSQFEGQGKVWPQQWWQMWPQQWQLEASGLLVDQKARELALGWAVTPKAYLQ